MDDEEGIWSMRGWAGSCAARRILYVSFYFPLMLFRAFLLNTQLLLNLGNSFIECEGDRAPDGTEPLPRRD
ncbi:hypothetical protein A9Q99_25850 [Gammaproteobacteria bacterium 45_16_T64]|nr:hypothetical protein A9Q99_25850 [Gammaproteobacteria bacterium 45_16_T64]